MREFLLQACKEALSDGVIAAITDTTHAAPCEDSKPPTRCLRPLQQSPPLAFRYCGVRRDRQATVDHIDGLLSEVSIARSARTTRNRRRRGELRQDAIEQRLIATEYGNVEQVRTCVLRLELGE
jgi:hypothetical protein